MEKKESDVERGSVKENTPKFPPLSGVLALASNIFSAIGVITINKWLFVNEEFRFVLTLSLLHFIVTCGVLHVMLRLGYFEWKKLPLQEVAKLSGTCTLAIMFMNLSLAQNTMGFYQLTKLLLIPSIVFFQKTFYGKTFSKEILISLFVLTFGIGLATVENVMVDTLGTVYALLAVLCHSWCQILIGSLQKELNASPNLLVFYQMHLNCLFILPLIPFFDNLSFSDPASLWNYNWSMQPLLILMASCLTAGILNISGFFVIGIFSPVTYSVSGHAKTILVLIMGFWLFGDPLTTKVALGIFVAAFGLAGYGYFT